MFAAPDTMLDCARGEAAGSDSAAENTNRSRFSFPSSTLVCTQIPARESELLIFIVPCPLFTYSAVAVDAGKSSLFSQNCSTHRLSKQQQELTRQLTDNVACKKRLPGLLFTRKRNKTESLKSCGFTLSVDTDHRTPTVPIHLSYHCECSGVSDC